MPTTVPPWSLDALRRSILARQGLIEPFDEPLQAVRAMVAVQTQYAASLPVAVATRLKKGRPGWEDPALEPDGSLIKSWSLRHTLHAHTREDHALVVGTLGRHMYPGYLRFMQNRRSLDTLDEMEARVLTALQARPLTRKELHEAVPELKAIEGVGWGLDVMGLAFRRRLCVVGRGAEQRFAALPLNDVEPSYGELLRRYLASYGPATLSDFAFWTGLKTPEVRAAHAEVRSGLVQMAVEGLKGNRIAIPETLAEPPAGSLGVRLLAKFDPLVLSYKDKSLFIPEKYRTRVFRIAGQVEAVVLSEGIAIATWRMERKASRTIFTVEPFDKLGVREEGRIRKEAARLSKFLKQGKAEVQLV